MAFDLEKFNAQVYTALTETVDQQVEVFNAASEGTLVLAPSNANMGDFAIRASFQLIAGLVRRRDANNGTDPIATARLLQLKNASVKVAAGTPSITFEPAQYRWAQRNPDEFALVVGEQLALATVQDQVNVAISGLGGGHDRQCRRGTRHYFRYRENSHPGLPHVRRHEIRGSGYRHSCLDSALQKHGGHLAAGHQKR